MNSLRSFRSTRRSSTTLDRRVDWCQTLPSTRTRGERKTSIFKRWLDGSSPPLNFTAFSFNTVERSLCRPKRRATALSAQIFFFHSKTPTQTMSDHSLVVSLSHVDLCLLWIFATHRLPNESNADHRKGSVFQVCVGHRFMHQQQSHRSQQNQRRLFSLCVCLL